MSKDQNCPEPKCKNLLVPYTGTGNPFKVNTGWCQEHGRQPLSAPVEETPASEASAPVAASTEQETATPDSGAGKA